MTIIGVIKGDTKSLDYSSCDLDKPWLLLLNLH